MNQLHISSGAKECRRQSATRPRARSSVGSRVTRLLAGLIVGGLALTAMTAVHPSDADDRRTLAALDTKYQKAVKENDAKTMAEILADDFVLVDGDGKRWTKADLVNDARSGKTHYEHQEDSERTVIVSGDTAVVTAKLWAKGIEDGEKLTIRNGSATFTCARQKVGVTFLLSLRCHSLATPSTDIADATGEWLWGGYFGDLPRWRWPEVVESAFHACP